jgi:hypothetical protein
MVCVAKGLVPVAGGRARKADKLGCVNAGKVGGGPEGVAPEGGGDVCGNSGCFSARAMATGWPATTLSPGRTSTLPSWP